MGAFSDRTLATALRGGRTRAVDGDLTDTKATPEELQAAVARWGLNAAPTASAGEAFRERQKKRRVRKLVDSLGTPGDYARSLMAKEPPPEWVAALREVSPVREDASYLVFAWKAPPLEPKRARWCLYEAVPDRLITVERRMELASAPFWRLPKEERKAQSLIVSAYQWEMYRAHRVDVRPFWCLQGAEGGTPLHHTGIEKRYLRLMGKPEDPFAVGDLPYAPWDERVRRRVVERDRLAKLGGSVERLRGTGASAAQIAANTAAEKEYRRHFWDWFTERMGPSTELYAYVLKHDAPDRERQSREDAAAAAEAREVFIETGRVPSPLEYKTSRVVASVGGR